MEINFQDIRKRLSALIAANEMDGGATFDRMAENIRKHAADGMIEEAIGYVPPEAESVSAEDVFRPFKKTWPMGRKAG